MAFNTASCPPQLHHTKQQAAACTPRQLSLRPHVSHLSARPGMQRPQVACPASMAASGGLAIYSWPSKLPVLQQPVPRSPTKLWSTQMWFEAMVQTVVKQLDGEAFLLRVRVNPVLSLQLVRLDPADLEAGWEHIQQQHLSSALQQDEALILVHPLASADRPCMVKSAGQQACTGCPHAASEATAAAAATAAAYGGGVTANYAAAAAAGSMELMQGSFGDCCSGDGDHSHSHHSHSHHSSSSHHAPSPAQPQQQHRQQTQTAFYGLVVQTPQAADPLQGCYLLKTMKQSSGSSSDCHCTHYSLNQVCKGPSLHQQYQASWLV